MNTQTISQFELLDTELLATVEGGNWKCTVGTVGMAVTTAVMSPPALWAIGYWGGDAVGAATFC